LTYLVCFNVMSVFFQFRSKKVFVRPEKVEIFFNRGPHLIEIGLQGPVTEM
jgi:hypothetical protein